MTRKKVKLAFIVNDVARKNTYKKRKKGLLKMVAEITTLCGIEACAIIYSSYDPRSEIWPSITTWNPKGCLKIKTMHEIQKSKNMVKQETFLKQRVSKVKKQLIKQRRDNMEKEMVMHMFECLKVGETVPSNTSKDDLSKLSLIIDQNLKNDIDRGLDTGINNNNDSIVELLPPIVTFQNEEIEMNNIDIMQGHWFKDINVKVDGEEAILFDNEDSLENEFWSNLKP